MNFKYDWWRGDWRNDPLIQRSRSPMLKTLAMNLIRFYVERGDTLEHMLKMNCGIMGGGYNRIGTTRASTAVGQYLIPGSKIDPGVRCSSRQIGAMLEHEDGRVEWNVFSIEDVFTECRDGAKPVQMALF